MSLIRKKFLVLLADYIEKHPLAIEQLLWGLLLCILMMFVILLVVVILPVSLNIGIEQWVIFKNRINKLKEERNKE